MNAICGAKTRAGTPCKRKPMANGRCNLHGGKSLSGADHPSTKSGRYSKHLPTKLRARYDEAYADATLLELKAEVALVDVRIDELIQQNDTEAWEEIKGLIEQRRKLVESERKRLKEADLIITVPQLNVVLAFILDSIVRHVSDVAVRTAISRDVDTLLTGSLLGGASSGARA